MKRHVQLVTGLIAVLVLQLQTPRRAWATPEAQAEAINQAGIDLFKSKNFVEAAKKFRAAIELDPNWATPYLNLCHALFGDGQIDASLAACQDALKRGLSYDQRVTTFGLVESVWAKKGKAAKASTSTALQCRSSGSPFESINPDGSRAVFCARTERIKNSNYVRLDDPQNAVTPTRGPDGSLDIDGPFIHYYASGEKKTEGYFDNGQVTGKSIGYYRVGAVEWISDRDRADGGRDCQVRKGFYETGEKMGESRGWSCATDPGTITTWYLDGTKKQVVSRSAFCSKPSVVNYHASGKVESQGCEGDKKEGEWKYFDTNGEAVRFENYTNGKLSGDFTRISNGVAVERGSYRDGMKQDQWRTWDETGKLLTDDEYRDDLRLTGRALTDARRSREKSQRQQAAEEAGDNPAADRDARRQAADDEKDAKCNVETDTVEAVADFFGEVEVSGQPAPVNIAMFGAGRRQVLIVVSSFGRISPGAASKVASRFVHARSSQRGLGITFKKLRVQCSASTGLLHIVKAQTNR